MMSLRVPLVQIILLIVGLLLCSLLSISGLSAVLAEVRLPLLMVLGVALLYAGLLQRQEQTTLVPAPIEDRWLDEQIHQIERGG